MERLTCKGHSGKPCPANYSNLFVLDLSRKTVAEYQKVISRLSAYEDTGLAPEEVQTLIADNKRLHELVDILENTIKAL